MTPHQRWRSRRAAGLELADLVAARLDEPSSVLVLGLPRGGVAVAAPLAATLGAELDVLVVRKAGVPWRPELAMGAVTADDVRVRNDDVLERVDVAEREIDRAFDAARAEASDREQRLRPGWPPVAFGGRTVVIVDDGLATGATARAAAQVLANAPTPPTRSILAVPVGPRGTFETLQVDYDSVVALVRAERFDGVGSWYDDFGQVPDEAVTALLQMARG